jgi:hypothetical protein
MSLIVLNEAQRVSGDTPPIIRSLKLHKQPLVLYTWKVVGRGCWTVSVFTLPDNVQKLHVRQPSTYAKPEAASAVLGFWWWAVCRPKHVELHIKQGIIKFWYTVASCWVFLCKKCTMVHGSTKVNVICILLNGRKMGRCGRATWRCTSTPALAVTVSSHWCDVQIPTAHRTSS